MMEPIDIGDDNVNQSAIEYLRLQDVTTASCFKVLGRAGWTELMILRALVLALAAQRDAFEERLLKYLQERPLVFDEDTMNDLLLLQQRHSRR